MLEDEEGLDPGTGMVIVVGAAFVVVAVAGGCM